MVRLIVMYNLPQGADEDAFLQWRLNHHQRANAALPGVVRTDFAKVVQAWPAGAGPRFRFVTILEWPGRQEFENAFFAPRVQAELRQNLERLGEFEYSICEIQASSANGEGAHS